MELAVSTVVIPDGQGFAESMTEWHRKILRKLDLLKKGTNIINHVRG